MQEKLAIKKIPTVMLQKRTATSLHSRVLEKKHSAEGAGSKEGITFGKISKEVTGVLFTPEF
jgi:hypothetical protein